MVPLVHDSPALQQILDEVKCDILSKTHASDNVVKRRELSRTFICTSTIRDSETKELTTPSPSWAPLTKLL